MGTGQLLSQEPILRPVLQMAERPYAVPGEAPDCEGVELFQSCENIGRELPLRSGRN